MTTPRTQLARRTRIASLLADGHVHSQEELRALLLREGIAVTQATLSRDLLELGASKVPGADGRQVYALDPGVGDNGAESSRLARVVHELVVNVECSANIVVVRTPPGAAQYLASAIDRSRWEAVLGTVAGDDTVFLVTRRPDGGIAVCNELLAMAEGRAHATAMGEG